MYQSQGSHHDCGVDTPLKNSAHWPLFGKILHVVVIMLLVGALHARDAAAAKLSTPSQSTTIALTSDDRRLVVVNREANSVSILSVRNDQGQDVTNLPKSRSASSRAV